MSIKLSVAVNKKEENSIDFIVGDSIIDNKKHANNHSRIYKKFHNSIYAHGKEKAAKLLIALGPEHAAKILRELHEDEIQILVEEMIRIKKISEREKKEILKEFITSLHNDSIYTTGKEEAKKILEKIYPEDHEKIEEILRRAENKDLQKEIKFLEEYDPRVVYTFLHNEHPQIIATIISLLKPSYSANLLKYFDQEKRKEILTRIAYASAIHPESLEKIIETLRKKLQKKSGEVVNDLGGVQTVVSILNHMERKYENEILDVLQKEDPELHEKIRSKLYTFEELELLDHEELRMLLSKIDTRTIAIALLGMPESFKRTFLHSLSQNRASDVVFEWDVLKNVPVKKIQDARNAILHVAKELDMEGIIIIKKDREYYT